MRTNDSVKWNILQDHDGSIFFTSNKGVKVQAKTRADAEKAFEMLVSNTCDVMKSLLDRKQFTTIQFTINY